MINTFNIATNELYYAFKKDLRKLSSDKDQSMTLKNIIMTLASLSRYNIKKSIALFKPILYILIKPKILVQINK